MEKPKRKGDIVKVTQKRLPGTNYRSPHKDKTGVVVQVGTGLMPVGGVRVLIDGGGVKTFHWEELEKIGETD